MCLSAVSASFFRGAHVSTASAAPNAVLGEERLRATVVGAVAEGPPNTTERVAPMRARVGIAMATSGAMPRQLATRSPVSAAGPVATSFAHGALDESRVLTFVDAASTYCGRLVVS